MPSCERILDALGGAFAGSAFSIRYVNVIGNQARVEGHYRAGDSAAQPRTVLLVDQDGEWRISDPG